MKKLTFFLLLVVSLHTLAQNRDLYFEHLNVVEGLPESNIAACYQDRPGYIWIGTQKYAANAHIPGVIASADIYCIHEDDGRRLWFVTPGWLCLFDRITLFNNAFYAVNLKQKSAVADYKPEVSLTTLMQNSQVVIKVKDNGNGIPEAIKDTIMQPFFTTKPTGEGPGLGLSLSYDIVVKGHGGGSILDASVEGDGSEFIVQLRNN